MSELNAMTREAVRMVHDGEFDAVEKLSKEHEYDFYNYMYTKGWIDSDRYLTIKGLREYNKIMASGDGPELLKEMFRG